MDILKQKFHTKALALKTELRTIAKSQGDTKIGDVSIKQMLGGMRGVKSMLWETSQLDPQEGIRFRGYSIPELKDKLPRFNGGKEPMPEALFWLMLVDEIPTQEQAEALSEDWKKRSHVPDHVYKTLDNLPSETHPMTQFCIAILSLQNQSIFAKKYAEGMSKNDYWDATYEDSMNLIASLPKIASHIYRRTYHNSKFIESNPQEDWSGNFAHMLGNDDPDFKSLMRLYLTIHADHEGGNASAHTTHLVGSTLSDAYFSFAGGMASLAGPLHGLANQEVIKWVYKMIDKLGTMHPSDEQINDYIQATLDSGQVIPGYGHAVLRQPDPRFIAQREFAKEYIKDSDIINIVWKLFDLVPAKLKALGKVRNPWPNVDAHSGAILVHYGMKEFSFYTVLFGVSRSLGVLAALCWSRALGFPLERPKSVTSEWLKKQLEN
jgi:citrate synthase